MLPFIGPVMLVLTIWLNPQHPVRHSLGIYKPEVCMNKATQTFQHRKDKRLRMELSCERTTQTRA